MNEHSTAWGRFHPKFFVTGVSLLGISICMCFGGTLMVYRSITLTTQGVAGEAIVQEYRGEVHTRRRWVTFHNHQYVLAYDGRTLNRQLPDRYEVGAKLPIVYVPGTVNMELAKDRLPLWQEILMGLAIALVGLVFGWLGYAFTLDGLGVPLPVSQPEPNAGNAGSGERRK